MLTLRFASDSVRRDCCDAPHMRRRWGVGRARLISRRLQQLEAMNSLTDLDFMPFDSREGEDGMVEVALDERLAVFVQRDDDQQQEGGPMGTTIVISAVGRCSEAVV
jgi:hypothetical protein